MSAPERFKERDRWTVAEILRHAQTGEKPESDEYREARRVALVDAGLEPDDPTDKPVEEWSSDDHLAEIQKENR